MGTDPDCVAVFTDELFRCATWSDVCARTIKTSIGSGLDSLFNMRFVGSSERYEAFRSGVEQQMEGNVRPILMDDALVSQENF